MVFDDPTLAPYQGREPYIFLSYSHRNATAAAAIIRSLNRAGFRVWYDQGLIPGREWDENVAHIILGCSFFLPVITQEYLASSNCRDELNYARDKEKPMLLVYLEDVELPAGMELRLGRLFAVHRSACASEEAFYSRIFRADGIARCNRRYEDAGPASGGTQKAASHSGQKKSTPPPHSSGSTVRSSRAAGNSRSSGGVGAVIGILLVLALAAVAAFLLLQRPSEMAVPPQTTAFPAAAVRDEQDGEAVVEVETTPAPEVTVTPSPTSTPTPTPTPPPSPSSEVVLPGGQSVISDPQETEEAHLTEEQAETSEEEDNLIVSSGDA